MGSSESIAQLVLSSGALTSAGDGDTARSWIPVAVDVVPGGRYGAVALVQRSGRDRWFGIIEVCRSDNAGGWEPLEGNGEEWGPDPHVRPDGTRLAFATGVFAFARDGVWLLTVAGVADAGVASLQLTEPSARPLAVNPANGAFVALITGAGSQPPAFTVVASDEHTGVDRLRWEPAPGMFDDTCTRG